MPFDFFQRFFIDQRADSHARCHAVADGQSGDGLAQFRHVFIIDGIVHVNAVDGDADLPGVTELVGDRAGDGGRDVGIVEDDQGSVATQFHRDVFHGGGRMGDSVLPTAVEPVNVILRTSGEAMIASEMACVSRQTPFSTRAVRRPHRPKPAGRWRTMAFGSPGLMMAVQPAASAGPSLRVSIAIGKFQGVMAADDADRLAGGENAGAGFERGDDFAVGTSGFFGEPLDEAGGIIDFAQCLGQGFSLLGGHQFAQKGAVFHDQGIPAVQDGGRSVAVVFRQSAKAVFAEMMAASVSSRPL